jgi:DUF1680 family protein
LLAAGTGMAQEMKSLDLSLKNRILAQDPDILVAPFKNRAETSCWQSEFWGKWVTSAILAYRYKPSGELKEKIDHAVMALIATQTKDGYIGNYTPEHRLEEWDIWGQKYCMLGLISYYDLTNDKKALDAASRLASQLISEIHSRNLNVVMLGNHHGMAASSVLEPVCLLYVRTGDKKFLDFAEEIVRAWESPDGPHLLSKATVDVARRFPSPSADKWYSWEQGQKAYEMMSCYEGLLEYYRITLNPEYLKAVELVWENIRNTEINIAGSGASKECWFGGAVRQALPVHHYQETCVTVTWIKLSYQLLGLTGESKYADAIEQSFYNALSGSVLPDGSDWAKYSPLSGQRMMGTGQCGMGLNCCVASGPRALFLIPRAALQETENGFQVNLFIPGTFKMKTPDGRELNIVQITNYPEDGRTSLILNMPESKEMMIRIRKPGWNENSALFVNSVEQKIVPENGYYGIKRIWKNWDTIRFEMDMPGRIHYIGGEPKHFAITRGPVVLSRDARLGGLNPDDIISPLTRGNNIDLVPVESPDPMIHLVFRADFMPESYAEEGPKPVTLLLCDYASAGNTYDDKSWFRTWFPVILDPSAY